MTVEQLPTSRLFVRLGVCSAITLIELAALAKVILFPGRNGIAADTVGQALSWAAVATVPMVGAVVLPAAKKYYDELKTRFKDNSHPTSSKSFGSPGIP